MTEQNSDASLACPPLCPHFGECGGCATQDIPYDRQLTMKQESLAELFGSSWTGEIPIAPSPILWNYRNKIDPNFGGKHYEQPPPPGFTREAVLGFKRKGRWYQPLEVTECPIAPEGVGQLFASLRGWLATQGLPPYDSRAKRGFLKALLVRQGMRTGERMVAVVTAPGAFDTASFVDAVQSAWPADSIHHAANDSQAGVAFAETSDCLHGAPCIHEMLRISGRELRFRLSPFSFFQTNTLATERLYSLIRGIIEPVRPGLLLDLYGGSGGIAFACADLVGEVWSVENVASASDDGRYNASVNGVDNVTFHTECVRVYLRQLAGSIRLLPPDTVAILDPPRAGMHPRALRRIVELAPEHIIYVACKPEVLARQELGVFLEEYEIASLRAVDLFPHTPHVEAVMHLVRGKRPSVA